MKMTRSLILLFVGFCLAPMGWTQSGPTLLIATDFDCSLQLDGQAKGSLQAGGSTVVPVAQGDHLVEARTADGLASFRAPVEAIQGQHMVEIHLKREHEQKVLAAYADQHPIWTDHSTGLMWTRKDNGGSVNWLQPANYCQNLSLGGYTGWRIPSISELARIYDKTQDVNGYHIKGQIQLTGWSWSGTPGNASGEAWFFDFKGGMPRTGPLSYSFSPLQALCVRRSGK